MNDVFTIGSFCFRLICPPSLPVPVNFMKFRGGFAPDYTYVLEIAPTLPPLVGSLAARRPDLLVTDRAGLEDRYLGIHGHPGPYACYREESDREARIVLLPEYLSLAASDPVFCSLLALERRQTGLDGLILHCAFVEYQGQAILFSAPSETGKTTQANLWEKHRNARTVNGDRALVQRLDGQWFARGWPVCGSSGVSQNRDVPIRAIVMLSQAPEDRAWRLSPMKAFTGLYSQITVNRWNREANLRAMGLIEALIADVPVYHLACTMNESAVDTLEAQMMR